MSRGASQGSGARGAARRVLRRAREGAFVNRVLQAELQRSALSAVDRALATELSYGVLRYQRRLDRALEAYAPRGLGRLDPQVLEALRLAAFQLLFLSRVPDHAAVNDAVGAIRALRGARVAGFANAVLRRLAQEGEPPLPAAAEDPQQFLMDHESLPGWLVELLLGTLGAEEAVAMAQAQNRPAPVWVRANPRKGGRDAAATAIMTERPGAELAFSRDLPEALRLTGGASPATLTAYQEGLVTVQDLGAQVVGRLCGARRGERILDACAGNGGKSTHLAELSDGASSVVAADSSSRKLETLAEHARRLGLTGIETVAVDLTVPGDRIGRDYDRILLDAPCSGLGVLRRHPELTWRRQPEDVGRLALLQARLLETLTPRLRPGGLLVYSVCTVAPEEGTAQIDRLLQEHPDLAVEPPDDPTLAAFTDARGLVRTLPHRHDADGFVAVRLRRRP